MVDNNIRNKRIFLSIAGIILLIILIIYYIIFIPKAFKKNEYKNDYNGSNNSIIDNNKDKDKDINNNTNDDTTNNTNTDNDTNKDNSNANESDNSKSNGKSNSNSGSNNNSNKNNNSNSNSGSNNKSNNNNSNSTKTETNTLVINPNSGSVTIDGKKISSKTSVVKNVFDKTTYDKPVRDGYLFTSWTKSGSCGSLSSLTDAGIYIHPGDAKTTCTITANWQPASTISLNPNGGTVVVDGVSYTSHAKITKPVSSIVKVSTSRYGYSFKGFSLNDLYENNKVIKCTAQYGSGSFYYPAASGGYCVVTANWEIITSKIIFKLGAYGGRLTLGDKTYYDDVSIKRDFDVVSSFPAPVRDDYVFDGWKTEGECGTLTLNSDGSGTFKHPATGGTCTLTPNWTQNNFLKINPNGGSVKVDDETITSEKSFGKNANEKTTYYDPTREDYKFTGWTQSGTCGDFTPVDIGTEKYTWYRHPSGIGTTCTLTANWKKLEWYHVESLDKCSSYCSKHCNQIGYSDGYYCSNNQNNRTGIGSHCWCAKAK